MSAWTKPPLEKRGPGQYRARNGAWVLDIGRFGEEWHGRAWRNNGVELARAKARRRKDVLAMLMLVTSGDNYVPPPEPQRAEWPESEYDDDCDIAF